MATADPEVYVHIIDLGDGAVREGVTENEDGSYSVFINARQASNIQLEAYEHALKHIRAGHFDGEDIQKIEAEAHGITPQPAEAEAEKPVKKKRRKLSAAEALKRKYQRRAEILARLGLEEVDEIEDGEYGEPVVRKRIRAIGSEPYDYWTL